MDNYFVMPYQLQDNDFVWCVIETGTEQLIKTFSFEDEALDYCEFLNDGGAFAGFTPLFVLREATTNKNLNQEFSEMLDGAG